MRRASALFGVLVGCGPIVVPQAGVGQTESSETSTPTADAGTTSPGTTEASSTAPLPQTTESTDMTSSASSTHGSSSAGSDSTVTTQPPGCGALDILIVLDEAMYLINEYLAFAAEGFAQQLIDAFPGKSLHVGLTVAREYIYGAPDCSGLGSLATTTEFGECELSNGLRFATDEDDLTQTLPCLMNIETGGQGLVLPISATIAALSDEQAQPGACNEGFLRDDALLGIFIFTGAAPRDTYPDDAHPDTDTSTWYSSVLEAKGGDAAAIAVFGFIATEPLYCINFPQVEAQNFIDFIDAFEHGDRRTICQGGPFNFEAEFADGVELMAQTCADWDGP